MRGDDSDSERTEHAGDDMDSFRRSRRRSYEEAVGADGEQYNRGAGGERSNSDGTVLALGLENPSIDEGLLVGGIVLVLALMALSQAGTAGYVGVGLLVAGLVLLVVGPVILLYLPAALGFLLGALVGWELSAIEPLVSVPVAERLVNTVLVGMLVAGLFNLVVVLAAVGIPVYIGVEFGTELSGNFIVQAAAALVTIVLVVAVIVVATWILSSFLAGLSVSAGFNLLLFDPPLGDELFLEDSDVPELVYYSVLDVLDGGALLWLAVAIAIVGIVLQLQMQRASAGANAASYTDGQRN